VLVSLPSGISANLPLLQNMVPRGNDLYREGAISNFLVPGVVMRCSYLPR
jgi:hypothetical protein